MLGGHRRASLSRTRSGFAPSVTGHHRNVEQRISLVTLGVSDLERSRTFYEALGWSGQTVEHTVFFQAGGQGLVLWGLDQLAADAGLTAESVESPEHKGFRGVTLAHNVRSNDEVDQVMAAAQTAGGRITKPAQRTFYGGYAGHFTDPDGHLWEIAHNPGFTLDADGSLTVPQF